MLETPKSASRAVNPATRATTALKARIVVGAGAAVLRARREVDQVDIAAKSRRVTTAGRLAISRASAEQARVEVDGEEVVVHLVVARVRPEAMVVRLEGMMVVSRHAITVGRLATLRASVDRVLMVEGAVEVVAEDEGEEEDQGEGGNFFLHTGTRSEIDFCTFLFT
jgi:hypothetical protein